LLLFSSRRTPQLSFCLPHHHTNNAFTTHSRTRINTGSCRLYPSHRDTSSQSFFSADLKDFISLGVEVLTLHCCNKLRVKKWQREKRKNDRRKVRGVTAGGKRIRRPSVLEGVGLSASSGGQRQQLSCLTDSDEAADSCLHESSHSIFLLLLLCSHLDSFSQREGIPPLRPLSSALRQSDC